MVSFCCDNCQDTVKKPKLVQLNQRCRNSTFSCIDCSVSFDINSVKGHISCITETQKFQKHLNNPSKNIIEPKVSIAVENLPVIEVKSKKAKKERKETMEEKSNVEILAASKISIIAQIKNLEATKDKSTVDNTEAIKVCTEVDPIVSPTKKSKKSNKESAELIEVDNFSAEHVSTKKTRKTKRSELVIDMDVEAVPCELEPKQKKAKKSKTAEKEIIEVSPLVMIELPVIEVQKNDASEKALIEAFDVVEPKQKKAKKSKKTKQEIAGEPSIVANALSGKEAIQTDVLSKEILQNEVAESGLAISEEKMDASIVEKEELLKDVASKAGIDKGIEKLASTAGKKQKVVAVVAPVPKVLKCVKREYKKKPLSTAEELKMHVFKRLSDMHGESPMVSLEKVSKCVSWYLETLSKK